MSKLTLTTNPIPLRKLLEQCHNGQIQLPDFQRSWVWEEERIKSLIASISRGFPVGALMTLKARNDGSTDFAYRGIQGTNIPNGTLPHELLLDGQQRMTSLYQTCMRQQVVETITAKKGLAKRWFYLDIQKCLDVEEDRDDAIISMPEDRKLKTNFDKEVLLDLSKPELEYEKLMFPINRVFDHQQWMQGFWQHWQLKGQDQMTVFFNFQNNVLENLTGYQVPVISLGAETSHEAVCVVFEKVNTGGKALDAFELLTAMYAAPGHKLRHDWLGIPVTERTGATPFNWLGVDNPENQQSTLERGIQGYFSEYLRPGGQPHGVLAKVAATDFLQAIALLHGREIRLKAEANHPDKESEWPAVRATRQALLDLPLDAYKQYCSKVVRGFGRAARFLQEQHIYRVLDIPYQSQLVPLAAIFAVADNTDHATVKAKISRWFWCGVFGELYGSAIESRFAKDIMQVPGWLADTTDTAPLPSTVAEGVMRPERLRTMRTRLSAAYKGIHALLMQQQARDFRSGETFSNTVFFQEAVDIHHIFPKKWCEDAKIPAWEYDSVINKTPLTYRTNRIIGGDAPSKYLAALEKGKPGLDGYPALDRSLLDVHLASHMIPVAQLRADDFKAFVSLRQQALMNLIAGVTQQITLGAATLADTDDLETDLPDDIARDSGLIGTQPD